MKTLYLDDKIINVAQSEEIDYQVEEILRWYENVAKVFSNDTVTILETYYN